MSFSFGTPSSAPATTGTGGSSFNFGATKPATPGFGSTAGAQPSTGLFNTPATSAPSFGSTAPAFGTATTSAFGSATPSFGTTSAAPTFSTAPTPAFGSLPNFGSSGTPAFGATSTAPTFGGATSTAPTFGTSSGFGLSFGAATTSTTTSAGLGGLGGIGFGTSTSTQNSNLLFGGTSTATTATSIFGAKLGTTNVTGTQPTVSATASFGLGGVAPVGGTAVVNAAGVKTEPPKQQKLPNEISTTLDSFKEFVKKQKAVSSEMMRVSIKPLHKVAREAEITLRATLSLCGEVCRARAHSRRLRAAAAAALAAADHAARDSLVQGMELESNAPPGYVKELLSELEQQLITFRRQMDVAAKQMQSSPKLLTEQELTLGIRRMHESLVALAGRLQAVHSQVEAQKEQYLNLRKYILKDPTNVFDSLDAGSSLDQILKDAETSRKKIKSGNLSDVNFNSAVFSDPRVTLGNIQQLAGPTPFPPTYLGNSLSSYPTTDASGPGWQPAPQSQLNTSMNSTSSAEPALQLHKPPGKRGKQSY